MTTAPTPLHQECTDFATSLRSASSVAMTTKGAAPPSFLRAADLFECAAAELRRLQAENERLQAKNASMRTTLEYVERWANHHGAKPHITAEQALGCIQHHPDIHDITKGYADGKRPNTFDPYARIAELEARKPLPPDALADKCEAWLQAGDASNIVDAFEAGYRAAERSEEGNRK